MKSCPSDPNSLSSLAIGNDYQCACATGFKWDPNTNKCIANCVVNSRTTATNNPLDTTACLCTSSTYVWNSA